MLRHDSLDEKKITKLTEQSDIERRLSQLTTDEIVSLLERLDELISCLPPDKVYSDLMRLKIMVLEEERLREEIEIS
ncbi:MAG: hypothetical protein HZB73_06635 [Nitrosarchaeum sp.]|nr:hypothetical protein [Nitrosarchaeum sp.]